MIGCRSLLELHTNQSDGDGKGKGPLPLLAIRGIQNKTMGKGCSPLIHRYPAVPTGLSAPAASAQMGRCPVPLPVGPCRTPASRPGSALKKRRLAGACTVQ